MKTYAYRLDHDLGFAPNPYHEHCTLACCMPTIRRRAELGDIIVGMAGSNPRGLGRIHPQLIYWMRVSEECRFDEYWEDERFRNKRPNLRGAQIHKVGDNTYRRRSDGKGWEFEASMHAVPTDPRPHEGHVTKDTSVDRVLIADEFTYWGSSGPVLPEHLKRIFPKTRNYKVNHDEDLLAEFQQFLALDRPRGVVGEPADWSNSKYFPEART